MSVLAGIGAKTSICVLSESTPGTPGSQSSALFLNFTAESVESTRNYVEDESIIANRMTQNILPGIQSVTGNITQNFDGQTVGQMLWFANGNTGYTHTAYYTNQAAPTATPAAGGTLPVNIPCFYVTEPIWQRVSNAENVLMPQSAESAPVIPSGSNLENPLVWVNPAVDSDYTQVGTAIFKCSPVGAQAPATSSTVMAATTVALPTGTYSNGTAGVGATFTVTAVGTLTIDGHLVALNDYILVKNQATGFQNGLYKCTTAGTISVAAILTRDTSMDSSAKYVGQWVLVANGTVNANTAWSVSNTVAPTVGTTAIGFTTVNGTETYWDFVAGTATTYTDTGASSNKSSVIVPYSASLVHHGFNGTPAALGVEPLTSFTLWETKDNDVAEQYLMCRVNSTKIAAGGGNNIITAEHSIIGQRELNVANFTPNQQLIEPFMGWQAALLFAGSSSPDCNVLSFEFTLSNGVEMVEGLCGVDYPQGSISGSRKVEGQWTRQFVDHTYYNYMQNGTEFAFVIQTYGQPIAKSGSSLALVANGISAVPYRYSCKYTFPRCIVKKGGANIANKQKLVETVSFEAMENFGTSTDLQIDLINLTTQYQ